MGDLDKLSDTGTLDPKGKSVKEEVSAENLQNTVFASQFDGPGLASKVENALQWLKDNISGQGKVRVTPKDDGGHWTWDKNVTLLYHDYESIHIDIDPSVPIDYPGNGTAITVDGEGVVEDQFDGPSITGGIWVSTGSDPDGWLKLKDTIRGEFHPTGVDFSNSTNDAYGVSMECHQTWTEANRLAGRYICDTGIVMKPSSVTGGSGGFNSFTDNAFDNLHMEVTNVGIHLRGKPAVCHFDNPTIFLDDPSAVGFLVDTAQETSSTIFTSPKVEDHNNESGAPAWKTTANYDDSQPFMIVGGRYPQVSTIADRASSDDLLPQIRFDGQTLKMGNLDADNFRWFSTSGETVSQKSALIGGEDGAFSTWARYGNALDDITLKIEKKSNGNPQVTVSESSSPLELWNDADGSPGNLVGGQLRGKTHMRTDVQDLSAYAPPFNNGGTFAMHDGSGSAPQDLYWNDWNNNQWVRVGDSSTTISHPA